MNDRHTPTHPTANPEAHSLLDRAVEAVKNEIADPAIAGAAAGRVLQRLSAEASAPIAGNGASGSIHGCEGFAALLPAYLSGALTESRRLLVEDHTRECVNCRREVQRLRRGESAIPAQSAKVASLSARRARFTAPRWAIAAGISALLVAGFAAARFLPWGSVDVRVASIQGELLDDGNHLLVAGANLGRGDVVRTARNSGAVLELADGSRFELGERSELSLARRHDGVVLDLARGGLIVEAARQTGGEQLFVKTGDVTVAVTGTVFSVNHGVKGSRVSVLDGEVRVSQSGRNGERMGGGAIVPAVLHPGDQYVSRADLARVPLDRDVAWSRDAARYRREIAALKTIGREIDQALASPLRTSTRLLDLSPAETMIYLAAPNVGPSLGGAWDRLQEQVAQNPAFAGWWNRQVGPHQAEIEEMISELREIGSGLGAEVAVAMGQGAESVVLLTEVPNPNAFSPILDQKIARFNQRMDQQPGEQPRLRRVEAVPATSADNQILIWLRGDLLLIATSPERLAAVDAAAQGTNPFVGTPFHSRIAAIYADGAGWIGAMDARRMSESEPLEHNRESFEASGLADVEAVVFNATSGETDEAGGSAGGSTRALISFVGTRRGVASWLAAPAPAGALEFVSPDAHLAFGALLKRPVDMLDDLLGMASHQTAPQAMAKFEREHGVALREDLAAALGGDVAFAFDGPWLPQPTWKLVLEVVDTAKLQSTIERLVTEWNASNHEKVRLVLTQEAAGNRPLYRFEAVPVDSGTDGTGGTAGATVAPKLTAFYLYEDGYLVAGPNRTLLLEAITQRNAGITLSSNPNFTRLLPVDGHVHFSAVVYQDLGAVSGLLGQWLGAAQEMAPEQRQELQALAQGSAGMVVAYGDENAIEIAGRTADGPFGLGFQKLLGLMGAFGRSERSDRSEEEGASGAERGVARERATKSRVTS